MLKRAVINIADALRSRRYLNFLSNASGLRNKLTKIPQGSQMSLNRLSDVDLSLFKCPPGGHAPWKIRNVRSPIALRLLKQNRVFDPHFLFSNPAAFKIAFKVPIGISSSKCQGTQRQRMIENKSTALPNYSLLLLFLLPMQPIDKKLPYKWSFTATETLWRGRYGNCDKGYYVDLPPAVVAHASLPPNPNHGFLISASNPQSIDQVTFDQGRIVGVEDEYNSMEMANPRAQLEWEIRNTPGTRLIRMYDTRFHGLAAAEASYQSPVNGKPQLTFELMAFRSDIVYTFRLITDRAHYAKDFLLYKRLKDGFQIYPIPPAPCTNP